jgi:hypothetical protein
MYSDLVTVLACAMFACLVVNEALKVALTRWLVPVAAA